VSGVERGFGLLESYLYTMLLDVHYARELSDVASLMSLAGFWGGRTCKLLTVEGSEIHVMFSAVE
jgi:hypothetical protein